MTNAYRDENHVSTLLGVSSVDGVTPVTLWADPTTHRLLTDAPGAGTGTVTDVSVTTANGVSGVVATSTTTPAITLTLGAITPTSVNGLTLTSSTGTFTLTNAKTLAVTNSLTLSGTDSTVMTFPTTSATIARTDAANTFTGVQTFSTPIAAGSVATMTATVGGGVPTPPNNTTTFLRGDGTFATPAGGGDMILASVQTNSGAKTFLNGTLLLRNPANTFSYTLTPAAIGADRVLTLPLITGSDTLASLGLAQTFSATQTFGTLVATTVNGNTFTTGTYTLTGTAAKTLNFTNSLTLTGTDGTTMTFPATSATIARTDAANTFTGVQTFSTPIATGSVATMTSTVGGGVPTPPNDAAQFLNGTGVFSTPAGGDDMVLASVQTVTGAKTFGTIGGAVGKLILAGSTSGSTILNAAATAGSTTVTLPGSTDTLVGLATTDTLTNKTLTSPKLNENVAVTTTATKLNYLTSATGTTGTASTNIVFSTSPVLTTPTIGAATGTSLVLSSFLNEAKGADIASAATTDLGAMTGNYADVTGTTGITALGTVQAGTRRIVNFTGILTITHNATSLILPTGANITTAAGDTATFVSLGSGNWKCVSYNRASGAAISGGGSGTVTDVSVTTANGVSGSVATSTTTPAITLTLGDITPTTVNNLTISRGNNAIGGNTALGEAVLAGANSGAGSNTAVGNAALNANTSGASNTAIGVNTLLLNTTGAQNTALGMYALQAATVNNNTGVGYQSLVNNSTGSGNVAIGAFSGKYETNSNRFYVDNQDRTDTTGDTTKALLYGTFNATASSQTLLTNSAFEATYGMNIPTGQTYKINGVAIAGGDVTKVGTPVNNQVGVWTGDGTIEGDTALTFDTATDRLSLTTSGILETGTIELGHASDTTIARASAGVASIEGNNIVVNTSSPTLATITTTGNIELGNASDTTVSRSAAGVIAVEGVVIPSISSTNTFTNKRITRRVTTTNAPGATPTTNTDNVDVMNFTGLNTAITSMTTNLSGTPVDGDLIMFRFTDDGTARAITWGASFAATTVALPTTTVISTMLRVGFQYSGSTWKCIATC